MTLCPVALVVGCKKCALYSACPLKSVIGDQPKEGAETVDASKSDTDRKF